MNGFVAQGMVVGCLSAAGAVAIGNDVASGHPPSFKQLAGFAFTSLGLATLAIPAPELAAGFSILILTSAVFVYAGPLLNAIGGVTATTSATTTTTGPSSTPVNT